MAEREGFEPSVSCPTAVFKTAALNHSTISPQNVFTIQLFSEKSSCDCKNVTDFITAGTANPVFCPAGSPPR